MHHIDNNWCLGIALAIYFSIYFFEKKRRGCHKKSFDNHSFGCRHYGLSVLQHAFEAERSYVFSTASSLVMARPWETAHQQPHRNSQLVVVPSGCKERWAARWVSGTARFMFVVDVVWVPENSWEKMWGLLTLTTFYLASDYLKGTLRTSQMDCTIVSSR